MSYQPPSRTRYYRDKRNGKVMGVCAGLANYAGFDVTLVRFAMIAAVFLSSGSILLSPDRPHEFETADVEEREFWRSVRQSPARTARDIRLRLKDIDRRLGDVESYVTTENRSLAREIEQLR
jgi:phage shock protein C